MMWCTEDPSAMKSRRQRRPPLPGRSCAAAESSGPRPRRRAQAFEEGRCVSTQATAGTTAGRISEPNWKAKAIISRCSDEKPVCDATSGDAVIATFFRKSASTPQAMKGSIAR